jgi:hypothetical protein
MTNRAAAIAAIRTCRTRDSLDDMLNRFEIAGEQNIIDCLNECMYNPQTFFASKPITVEDELEFTKQIFLTGTWRLNDYYDRMGIAVKETAAANA